MPYDFVVGLGGNLGDRGQTLARGVEQIVRVPGLTLHAVSRVFESAPQGPTQPYYLNAALRIAYEASAHELLASLLAIETQLGRTRNVRWGPRTLDLDILWGDEAVHTEQLTIPHPHLCERAFALMPLLEVAPELGGQYGARLARLDEQPALHGRFLLDVVTGGCAYVANGPV